jgi:bifunctional non-homologous end joining protein LigD
MQIEPARCKRKMTVDELLAHTTYSDTFYEEKYDGVRFLLQIRPNRSTINFLTTRHKSKKNGRYCEEHRLTTITKHLFPEDFTGTVFDGEMIGKGISTDVQHFRTTGEVSYVVFDLIYYRGEDVRNLPWTERRRLLHSMKKDLPKWMKLSEPTVHGKDLLKRVLEKGGEGVVMKEGAKPYGIGWTKVKRQETHDVVIWGYLDTKSAIYKKKGWIGSIRLAQFIKFPKTGNGKHLFNHAMQTYKDRIVHDLTVASQYLLCIDVGRCDGFDQKLRAEISKNKPKFIGRVLEIKCDQQLASGYFRMPKFLRWRDDKNPDQCFYEPRTKN